MKIIHTSDWHLGHVLYTYDRTFEQRAFLTQLAEIVGQEQPDALVVSGDIYHTSTPSAAVQKMYTDTMLDIHRRCPDMTIVVTAGNHDSSARLEVNSELWDYFKLKVIGGIERREDGSVNLQKHIVEVKDAGGQRKGFIIAVPHVYPQNFPLLEADTVREDRMSRFFARLEEEVQRQNDEGLPVVMMAHLAIAGSDRTGHDTVGGIDYYPIEAFGTDYDYLALGHIHCPQTLAASHGRARYCGTPIPISFDEAYPHSVSIVTLQGHDVPLIRDVPIHNPIPLLTLPALPTGFDEALDALKAFPGDRLAYLRLNVALNGSYLPPDCQEQVSEAVKDKCCKFCYIKSTRMDTPDKETETHLTIDEIREKSPLDIARLYYKEATGTDMEADLEGLFKEVIEGLTPHGG